MEELIMIDEFLQDSKEFNLQAECVLLALQIAKQNPDMLIEDILTIAYNDTIH